MRSKTTFASSLFALGALLLGLAAIADGPPGPALLLPFQGRLENGGVPLNVDVDVQFSVYDVQNGGSSLWSQTRTLTPENGAFHVVLGEQSALPDALRTRNNVYLEVSIDGNVLGSRSQVYPAFQAITSNGSVDADYALYAGEAGHADLADGNATGTFRVQKNGSESKITFDSETNDPGQIVHEEVNNTAALWLDPSDDFHATSGSTDKVIIGDYDSGYEKFYVDGAGDGYFDRNLDVNSDLSTGGALSVGGSAQVDGTLSLKSGVFGGYILKNKGTAYVAAENGFVVSTLYAQVNGSRGYTDIIVDNQVRGRASVHYYINGDNRLRHGTVTLPVSKGSTYKVEVISSSFTINNEIYWVPMAQ